MMRWLLIWIICALTAVASLVWMLFAILGGAYDRAHFLAIGFDQTGNAMAGGWPDETFSSRTYRTEHGSWRERCINRLLGADHCYLAFVSEQLRRQLPPALR